jgi:phage terminase small subunit
VTPESAATLASRLLGKVEVQQAIAAGRAQTLSHLSITRERVLLEAARLAFYDARRLYHPDGRPKELHELDDDTAACIAGLEVLEQYESDGEGGKVLVGHVKKWKVADKNPAVERLFKHLGEYDRDNRQKGASLADALGQFIGQLHGSGAAKLKPVAPADRPKGGA